MRGQILTSVLSKKGINKIVAILLFEQARQKAETCPKREDELAEVMQRGQNNHCKMLKRLQKKSKADILADVKIEAGRLKEKANRNCSE